MSNRRNELIAGLQGLIEAVRELDEATVGHLHIQVNAHECHPPSKSERLAAMRALSATHPEHNGGTCWTSGTIGAVRTNVFFPPHLFECQATTRTVTEEVPLPEAIAEALAGGEV